MFRRALLTLALALAVTLPGFAQEQTGSIAGTAKDSSGAVLPGVTVELKNLSKGTAAGTQTTDSIGQYRFIGLIPGQYEVYAKLQGFNPAKVENINLRLGQVLTIDLALSIGGQAETVQVTAESPLIDIRQSARGTNLTAETIERLPRGRDFTSVVTQAPGANQETRSGGISIDGASASENRYIIDGAETTNLQNGLAGKPLVTDFISEVQVKSSGYTAEYGGSTGGVINVVTKSGTNQFRGDVLSYFSGDGMESAYRPTLRLGLSNSDIAEYVTYPEDKVNRIEPGFALGGPIARDKVWFFGSYIYRGSDIERDVTFRSTGQTSTFDQKFTTHNSSNNVTAQMGNNLRGRFAVNISNQERENLLPAIDGSGSPTANYNITRKTPTYSYSGNLDYVVNNSWFFGVRGGYYMSDAEDLGVYDGTRYLFLTSNIGQEGVPPSLQRSTNFSNVPTNSSTTQNKQTRFNLQADTSFYVNAGGQHAFKAGVQMDQIGLDVLDGETGNLVRISWNRALSGLRGPYGYYQVRSNGAVPQRGFLTQGDVSNNNVGLFIQDAWTIKNRLTVNLGLRTENETVPSFSADPTIPSTAFKFSFADKLAPRLGFSWDVAGDGKTKVYGSWGMFYDIFKLELPLGSFGGQKWLEYYYTLDTPDWPNLDTASCPPACPGTLIRGPIDFRHPSNDPTDNLIDPDISPMRMQEAAFGVERELSNRLAVSARYVHKQVDKAVEDIGKLDEEQNEIYPIGNPGYGRGATFFDASGVERAFPKAVRDYDALELALDKRYSNNWQARVSYTLSRLYGNYSGLSQSDENGRTSPNVGRNFDYPVMSFNEQGEFVFGRLGTDRPHQFKVQGLYEFNFGTTVGANYYLASGVPITREAAMVAPNNFPVQYLGRLSDGRTDVFSQTDLYIAHAFKLGGDRRLELNFNVINLFNQKIETNVFTTELAVNQGLDIDEASFYNGFNTAQLIAEQGIPRDPRFLQSSAFQEQLQARFGVKFSF